MMKRRQEFLNRLFDLIKCRTLILEYLKEEKLISDDLVQTLLVEHHSTHAARIATLLDELHKQDRLQLVDYEWTILPFEHLKLTIVSHSGKKEFFYDA
jgi:hypothetical protein